MTTFSTRGQTDLPAEFRTTVDAFLETTLRGKLAGEVGTHLDIPIRVLRDFLAGGGKRLRPIYCYCGWLAAGGDPEDPVVVRLGAAVELYHAFALMHDDVIDASDIRRGHPTAQRAFEHYQPRASTARFGENAALLLGDLCADWADELFGTMHEARRMFTLMRTELVVGQYLDLCGTGDGIGSLEQALTVDLYKTGSYTVQRPLHIGAAAAGAGEAVFEACSAYGLPLGQAFQMCDDLEDVVENVGDPGYVGNDLKEGKATVPIALAMSRADPGQRRRLGVLLADPELGAAGAAEARAIIAATGAIEATIEMIGRYRGRALDSLRTAPFPPHVAGMLEELAWRAVRWPA
ncbi:geranylgeranyl diphosphate synthase, type I [Nonomuraea solani]|uniref:Geranylgeranyl diphosphate synthase, type I n=1 Tax=Nonomuraea solani TaxID=1144553 RepID=A0A1H5ZMD0_9ACTN|nr:polyprenyl synthetase family protein [Nonomuraea solani]SEG36925.1 geranylgeranyl diphosphate synthase, type I [Nonomuraea solani]